MDMVNAVREFFDETGGIHHLPLKMTRIKVEAEFRTVADGFQRAFRRVNVECDFRRMNFKGKTDSAVFEFVHDGIPGFGEEFTTGVDHVFRNRGEAVQHVPDRGTGESGHDFHAEVGGGACAELHLLNRPFAFGILVPGESGRRETVGAAVVVGIAGELPGKMIADRPDFEIVLFQGIQQLFTVFFIGCGFVDIQMVAAGGEFESLIAPGCGFFRHCLERQIRPLSGEQSDWSHSFSLLLLGLNGI